MAKPRLGVILREPFKPGDETHRVLQSADHVILGDKLASRIDEKLLNSLPRHLSVFIHSAMRTPRFLAELAEDIMKLISLESVIVEENPLFDGEFESTKQFVTNLLALRPEMKIGIASSLRSWDPQEFDILEALGKASQVFPCPMIDRLEQASYLLPGSVPVMLSMSEKEKAFFSEGPYDFSEFIFWRPGLLTGIEFKKEVLMEETKSDAVGKPYKALYPSAKRETPSLGAKVKGTLVPEDTYWVVETKQGAMDVRFGKLQDGFWVVLSQGQETYLKELVS